MTLTADDKELWEIDAKIAELQSALTASEKRAETARDDALAEAAKMADAEASGAYPEAPSYIVGIRIAQAIRAMKGKRP